MTGASQRRGDHQPDHLAGRLAARGRRRRRLLRAERRARRTRRPRHAGLELARLSARSRRPHQRAVLRHRAGRLGRPEQAAHDVQPRLSRTTATAADVGDGRGAGRRSTPGTDINAGFRSTERLPRTFDVDGVVLARPFKIVKIGPVRLFVQDVERSADYYTRILGLTPTADFTYAGHRCVFLRATTEHHTLALYPLSLRSKLGLSEHTTCLSFGLQLATYRQLRNAVTFLRERGVTVRELPPELSPGIDYSAFAIDPDGHAIQLYYYMQQVGSDGQPVSGALRRRGAERIETWPAPSTRAPTRSPASPSSAPGAKPPVARTAARAGLPGAPGTRPRARRRSHDGRSSATTCTSVRTSNAAGHHDRALGDAADAQNGRLGRVDDGREAVDCDSRPGW